MIRNPLAVKIRDFLWRVLPENLVSALKYCYERFLDLLAYLYMFKYFVLFSFFKNRSGVIQGGGKSTPLIVSLTSFPERISSCYLAVETLLRQTVKPDHIYLWLSEEEFPGLRKDLPKNLLSQERRGLAIKFCKKNIGPYKKLVYTLKENPDANIVVVDDDTFYPNYILERLLKCHEENPEDVVGGICEKIKLKTARSLEPFEKWGYARKNERSFLVSPAGAGGVLYPPNCLDKRVFNEKIFLKICASNDDAWFKAMSLLKNVRCRQAGEPFHPVYIPNSQKISLSKINIVEKENDKIFKRVFEKYGLFKKLAGS